MSTSNFEAAKARVEKTIRHYVSMFERNGGEGWPTADFCDGLIQMASVTGHLSDTGIKYWEQKIGKVAA